MAVCEKPCLRKDTTCWYWARRSSRFAWHTAACLGFLCGGPLPCAIASGVALDSRSTRIREAARWRERNPSRDLRKAWSSDGTGQRIASPGEPMSVPQQHSLHHGHGSQFPVLGEHSSRWLKCLPSCLEARRALYGFGDRPQLFQTCALA